ncbi:MAG: FIG01124521: hypothetical protein, partial [uncultured Nocardioides sp.]
CCLSSRRSVSRCPPRCRGGGGWRTPPVPRSPRRTSPVSVSCRRPTPSRGWGRSGPSWPRPASTPSPSSSTSDRSMGRCRCTP